MDRSTRPIKIKPVFIDYVMSNDKISINTNNCWSYKDLPPADYYDVLNAGNTKNWIYRFHDRTTIKTLVLDAGDLEWMRKAMQICAITGQFSELFEEDLEWTLDKHKESHDWISKGEWFIRTEGVSLKNGIYGTGPYKSLEMIIKSIVSSKRTHRCFEDDAKSMILYFFPFLRGLDHMKEFRVFIYEGEITAISQQSLYHQNPWFTHLHNTDRLEDMIRRKILEPYEKEIKPKIDGYLQNYVMDFSLISPEGNKDEDDYNKLQPYFIEPNCWGANYAAGSSLFGWVQDHAKLHDHTEVEFRYTIASNEILEEYLQGIGRIIK